MRTNLFQYDFTIDIYCELLKTLQLSGYDFQTYHNFVNEPSKKAILLRHDVDDRKEHSLQFAKIQYEMGIVGTYYFRMVPQSFNKKIIQEIASLGHEIGYHYEDMDFAKGDIDKAFGLAKKHLAMLREVTEVKTICMHGSPRSSYDNKEVWKKYNYRELGIIAEPYFDLDFSQILYLTDTGRRWDGEKVSIRDKVTEMDFKPLSKQYSFHATQDIIKACVKSEVPNQIMMNFHPQRWTDNPIKWTQELVWQNSKNLVKACLVKFRN